MQGVWRYMVIVGVLAGLAMQVRAADPQSSSVGQELKKVQKDIIEKQDDTPKKKPTVSPEKAEKALKAAADSDEKKAGAKADKTVEGAIKRVEWKGDVALLDQFGLRRALEGELTAKKLTMDEIRKIASSYRTRLVEQGFYLAQIEFSDDIKDGVLVGFVDQGRVGKITLQQRGTTPRAAFGEKYYTTEQVSRLIGLKEGAAFQYADLYRGVYRLNTHPDIMADAELKIRKEKQDGFERRYVDADILLEDNVPVHGALEFQNTGTDVTDEWRAGLTLQHINLTRHDDILTLNIPVSLDLESIRSIAGGYYLPYAKGKGGAVSVNAGYSELQADEIVGEDIDLNGEGWFVGALWMHNVVDNDKRIFSAGLGIARKSTEQSFQLSGIEDQPTKVEQTPISLVLSYAGREPDRLGGRNFISSETAFNFGGFLGSTDDDEFAIAGQRENAPADFVVERLQLARIQPLSRAEQNADTWLLFGKVEGQLASDPLIAGEQIAAGGLSTVRGYEEREVLGDDGLIGSLELRSPVYASALTERLFTRKASPTGDFERLQAVVFVDGAYTSLQDTAEGQDDTQNLLSVGAGLRLALGKNFQSRFDWGFPLEETEESDSGGRGHVSVQFLF